jgi:hypothetical protein
MADEPKSMSEVAVLMRQSLPDGISPSEFGERIGWGRGSDEALNRMKTLTTQQLTEIGLTRDVATQWALAYEAVGRLMPDNPSAAGRAALMHHAAKLLGGK